MESRFSEQNRQAREAFSIADVRTSIEATRSEEEPINIAEPPITARRNRGEQERYPQCDDAKIHDPEHGLFWVGDGVSGQGAGQKIGAGAAASRETARSIQKHVGAELDREIEAELLKHDASDPSLLGKIKELVDRKMSVAMAEADQKIQVLRRTIPRFEQATTTSSLIKTIELPSGETYGFIHNVGDSRVYLLQDGELRQMTIDDSVVHQQLKKMAGLNDTDGNSQAEIAEKMAAFEESVRVFEAAQTIDALPDAFRILWRFRNAIEKAVGDGRAHKGEDGNNLKSRMVKLKQGDRLLVVSDGVTGFQSRDELKDQLLAQGTDQEVEQRIQQTSDDRMGDETTSPKKRADDVSAVVNTVRGRLHERERLQESVETSASTTPEHEQRVSREVVAEWKTRLNSLDHEIEDVQRRIRDEVDGQDTLTLEITLAAFEEERVGLEYWIAKEEQAALDEVIPPRFEHGFPAKLPSRFESRTKQDPYGWRVMHYEPSIERYRVMKGMEYMVIDRHELELAQPTLSPKEGDQLPMKTREGVIEEGWRVAHVDGATVIARKESADGEEKFRAVSSEVAAQAIREAIELSRAYKQQMRSAQERLQSIQARKSELAEKKHSIDLERALQNVQSIASEMSS